MSLQSIVDFYKTTDLTGQDIYNLINRFPILYSDLSKYKNLKELLSTNSHLSMQEQKELLDSTFKKWIGNLEQVDDVTLIGVRV